MLQGRCKFYIETMSLSDLDIICKLESSSHEHSDWAKITLVHPADYHYAVDVCGNLYTPKDIIFYKIFSASNKHLLLLLWIWI